MPPECKVGPTRTSAVPSTTLHVKCHCLGAGQGSLPLQYSVLRSTHKPAAPGGMKDDKSKWVEVTESKLREDPVEPEVAKLVGSSANANRPSLCLTRRLVPRRAVEVCHKEMTE